MVKIATLILLVFFVIACDDANSKQTIQKNNISCLVQDNNGIIACFEGEFEHVKNECVKPKSSKNGLRVRFSKTEGCPIDMGYVGYCVMDNGKYIPYDYIDPLLNISNDRKKMMEQEYQKSCIDFNGKWFGKVSMIK